MAHIKGYFFNAQSTGQGEYDRLYNNSDFCGYLDKIIGNGVFPNPADQLEVVPYSGLQVMVKPGQAWVNGHKMIVELEENVNEDPGGYIPTNLTMEAGNTYRVLVVANEDVLVRAMQITLVQLLQDSTEVPNSLVLADIVIPAGATTITSNMITDHRGDPAYCPWVAGLIDQVDSATMLAQFNQLINDIKTWQTQQQEEFDDWFLSLQHGLPISADLVQYHKIVQGGDGVDRVVPLDMVGYTYDRHDLFIITMNGLNLTSGYDYELNTNTNPISIRLNTNITAGNVLDILVIKSSLQSSADGMVTLITGNTFVHIPDAIFNEQLRKLEVTNLAPDAITYVAVTNRNLARIDSFPTTTVSDLVFSKTDNGKINILGSTADAAAYVTVPLPSNTGCFVPGESYNLSINGSDLVADDAISVYVSIDGTRYTVNKTTDSVSFTIPSEFTSITLIIAVEGINRESINATLEIQLEYGGHKTEWVTNTYNEYAVGDTNLPVMYDIINNIWIITPNASGLKAAYFVLNSTSSGDNVLYPLDS